MSIISMFPGGGKSKINVIAATSALTLPATAKDGTIAIITSTALGTVYIGNQAISAPAAGDVQIRTSASVPYPIEPIENAQMYPLNAQQYSGSAWTTVDMYVRSSGAWVQERVWLLNGADKCTAITGGWVNGYCNYGASISLTDQGIAFSGPWSSDYDGISTAVTNVAVDVTAINTLTLHYTMENPAGTGGPGRSLALLNTKVERPSSSSVAYVRDGQNKQTSPFVLDVSSLTGSYYVAMSAYHLCTIKATQMYGE